MKKLDLNLDDILHRIAAIEGIAFSDTELGTVLGKARSTVSSWRQRNSIPYADIIEYCIKNSVSLDAVFLNAQPTTLSTEAVHAIIEALSGHTLEEEKRRKIVELVAAKWPISAEELKLIVELAI